MPDSSSNIDPRLRTLAHLRAPLCVIDVPTMRVVWANADALSYWNATSPDELDTENILTPLPDASQQRLEQARQTCYDNDVCLTESCDEHSNNATRSTNIALSAFPMDGCENTLLVEFLCKEGDVDSSNRHTTIALTHTATMISLYDHKFCLLYANPAARNTLPADCDHLEKALANDTDLYMIQESIESKDNFTVELEVNTVDGPRWHNMNIQSTASPITDRPSILVSATDATERRLAQQTAYNLAYNDSLTGLPNRAAMTTYLNELLAEENKDFMKFGLFFLDLDRFKVINDSLGHSIGDQLLIEVAHRLKKTAGAHGMVCRLGGDEFVVIVINVIEKEQLGAIAEKIIHAMSEPVSLGEHNLRIRTSIGISAYPTDGADKADIMQNADAAMYMAKAQQSGFCFYDRKMSVNLATSVKNRLDLESDLAGAIDKNEFELYYQPKISCKDMSVTGFEALIRWHHPSKGMINPADFIPIAEESGQIIELGNWVLESAMQQQKAWSDARLDIPVAINVSARQFKSNDLILNVSNALKNSSCNPSRIELEITESMLLGDAEQTNEILHQLSAMGIRIALDDFGTGYSNLAYLQQYPLDTLKIDRVFLAEQSHSMLMGVILNMGKVLGLNVIAEGVETEAQVNWLVARGCDHLQGFYFSRPLTVDAATRYLKDKLDPEVQSADKAA